MRMPTPTQSAVKWPRGFEGGMFTSAGLMPPTNIPSEPTFGGTSHPHAAFSFRARTQSVETQTAPPPPLAPGGAPAPPVKLDACEAGGFTIHQWTALMSEKYAPDCNVYTEGMPNGTLLQICDAKAEPRKLPVILQNSNNPSSDITQVVRLAGPIQSDPPAKDQYTARVNVNISSHAVCDNLWRNMNFPLPPGTPLYFLRQIRCDSLLNPTYCYQTWTPWACPGTDILTYVNHIYKPDSTEPYANIITKYISERTDFQARFKGGNVADYKPFFELCYMCVGHVTIGTSGQKSKHVIQINMDGDRQWHPLYTY